jgi:GTP cyclohydrolase I
MRLTGNQDWGALGTNDNRPATRDYNLRMREEDDAIAASEAPSPAIVDLVRRLLVELGENPERGGLVDTPERVARAYRFLTEGNQIDPLEIVGRAVFEEDYNEMVVVRDIELYSLCEHHLLPFYGRCHIAYLPNGKIVGLSKLARLADVYARRLQVQERLTTQIAEAIEKILKPKGVAVVIEARHLCMMMRGVEKQNSFVVTDCLLGRFRSDPRTRGEFFAVIGK